MEFELSHQYYHEPSQARFVVGLAFLVAAYFGFAAERFGQRSTLRQQWDFEYPARYHLLQLFFSGKPVDFFWGGDIGHE